MEIQAGSDSKPGSPKFIYFSLLRGKFSRFKWLTTAVLIKVSIVINKKKKLQKVNNYGYDNSDDSDSKSEPGSSKFISFLLLRGKFSHFKWLITVVLMKVPIVVNKKKKLRKVNNYDYDNSDNNNGESEPRPPKFISFSLLMDQEVPSNLQLRL